ncbi:MAG TPA: hypothetical protein PLC80_01320 [Draconibacterium sp.]|nr:hypothetical protein [Draconibacterium sp.]
MNHQKVINHRAKLRLKRLFYQSRAAMCETPVNYNLIDDIQQKMNRLLKMWKSDSVAGTAKKHKKATYKLSNCK